MHHLSPMLRREHTLHMRSSGCQDRVRFFALLRIKPHAPPLVRVPVNSFEFHSCERTPQVDHLMRLRRHRRNSPPTPGDHRLRRGLPGYLILFAPHAFEPQCQLEPSRPPSLPVFLPISTHSTATPGIPSAPTPLKTNSIERSSEVEPRHFTFDLPVHLRSLYTQ